MSDTLINDDIYKKYPSLQKFEELGDDYVEVGPRSAASPSSETPSSTTILLGVPKLTETCVRHSGKMAARIES